MYFGDSGLGSRIHEYQQKHLYWASISPSILYLVHMFRVFGLPSGFSSHLTGQEAQDAQELQASCPTTEPQEYPLLLLPRNLVGWAGIGM